MPSHRHYITAEMLIYKGSGGTTANYNGNTWNWVGGVNSDYTGGGSAHNNLPPYLAVNIYKRVALTS